MVRQGEGVEDPDVLHPIAVTAVQADIAGKCRGLATDVNHPRHIGPGQQVDDRTSGT